MAGSLAGVSPRTVTDWFYFCRDVCTCKIRRDPQILGCAGHIFQTIQEHILPGTEIHSDVKSVPPNPQCTSCPSVQAPTGESQPNFRRSGHQRDRKFVNAGKKENPRSQRLYSGAYPSLPGRTLVAPDVWERRPRSFRFHSSRYSPLALRRPRKRFVKHLFLHVS